MNKRLLYGIVFVPTMLVCCYEAWVLWGVAGLVVGSVVAVLATIAGLKTFSPK